MLIYDKKKKYTETEIKYKYNSCLTLSEIKIKQTYLRKTVQLKNFSKIRKHITVFQGTGL